MDAHFHAVLRRIARTAGLVVCLFIATFAADSAGDGLGAVVPHLLPAMIVLAVVLVAWRWDLVGGVAFMGLAVGYAFIARSHLDWILTVSLPLATTGALFLWVWRGRNDKGLRFRAS